MDPNNANIPPGGGGYDEPLVADLLDRVDRLDSHGQELARRMESFGSRMLERVAPEGLGEPPLVSSLLDRLLSDDPRLGILGAPFSPRALGFEPRWGMEPRVGYPSAWGLDLWQLQLPRETWPESYGGGWGAEMEPRDASRVGPAEGWASAPGTWAVPARRWSHASGQGRAGKWSLPRLSPGFSEPRARAREPRGPGLPELRPYPRALGRAGAMLPELVVGHLPPRLARLLSTLDLPELPDALAEARGAGGTFGRFGFASTIEPLSREGLSVASAHDPTRVALNLGWPRLAWDAWAEPRSLVMEPFLAGSRVGRVDSRLAWPGFEGTNVVLPPDEAPIGGPDAARVWRAVRARSSAPGIPEPPAYRRHGLPRVTLGLPSPELARRTVQRHDPAIGGWFGTGAPRWLETPVPGPEGSGGYDDLTPVLRSLYARFGIPEPVARSWLGEASTGRDPLSGIDSLLARLEGRAELLGGNLGSFTNIALGPRAEDEQVGPALPVVGRNGLDPLLLGRPAARQWLSLSMTSDARLEEPEGETPKTIGASPARVIRELIQGGGMPGLPAGERLPRFFFGPELTYLVASREDELARIIQHRRHLGSLLVKAGGYVPPVSETAALVAEGSPPNAIPVPGGQERTHGFHLDVDFALMEVMDAWEAAYPGRAPYITPRGEGEGKDEPDFQDQMVLEPVPPPLPPAPKALEPKELLSLPEAEAKRKLAGLMKDLGLSDGKLPEPPGYRPDRGVQGEEPYLDMALVRPIMTVVTQRAQPLLSSEGSPPPSQPIKPVAEEVLEVDPNKLEYVVERLYERIWEMMDLEKQRRGF